MQTEILLNLLQATDAKELLSTVWVWNGCSCRSVFSVHTVPPSRTLKSEGKDLGPQRFRPFYANQSSELNFPIFLGEKRPEFRRKRNLYEPLLTAMAQVLPLLIKASLIQAGRSDVNVWQA